MFPDASPNLRPLVWVALATCRIGVRPVAGAAVLICKVSRLAGWPDAGRHGDEHRPAQRVRLELAAHPDAVGHRHSKHGRALCITGTGGPHTPELNYELRRCSSYRGFTPRRGLEVLERIAGAAREETPAAGCLKRGLRTCPVFPPQT